MTNCALTRRKKMMVRGHVYRLRIHMVNRLSFIFYFTLKSTEKTMMNKRILSVSSDKKIGIRRTSRCQMINRYHTQEQFGFMLLPKIKKNHY